jgi:hypothetical protein
MRFIKYFLSIGVFILSFLFIQQLFMPKYASSVYEGGLIREYYQEPVKDHDVLIIGDCEVYENISPVTLWEEYGFTSYIRGSAQQLIWNSYYLLEEALRYETPDAVVFNVLSMQYDQPQAEEFNRITLDDMKLSDLKLKAVEASQYKGETALSYIFPLFRFHDRWSELSAEDFRYFFSKPPVSVNGFMVRCDIRPVDIEDIPKGMKRADYTFGANAYKYLDMITNLCQERNIPLLLIKAPVYYPYWYPEWDEQMIEYAAENNVEYINFLNHTDEIGLDFSQDTYDGGLHLNLYGAEKFSRFLGKILQQTYTLPDRRNEPETAERWAKKTEIYREIVAAQEREWREDGAVKSFLLKM